METHEGQIYTGFEIDQPDTQFLKIIYESKLIKKIPRNDIVRLKYLNSKIICMGTNIYGNVLKFNDSTCFVQSKEGKVIEIKRRDINSIEILKSSNIETYPSVGLSIGSPGGINIVLGYMLGAGGIRFQAGSWFTLSYGLQGNLFLNSSKTEFSESNFSLGLGYAYDDNGRINSWGYGGFFYDVNFRGIFFELGVTIKAGSSSNISGSFQLGYFYRFND
ncbi:MAG: hypothetical protein ABSG15_04600 [FCB group bacterium]